jgi:heat shock protein HslJ
MICKPSFSQPLTVCVVALAVGLVGVIATNPAMAQPSSNNLLLMAQSSSIAGSWRLVSMGSLTSPTGPLQTTELTADFEGDRISGSGGCNRFNGGYQTESNQLTIGALASTRMACEQLVMNQEAKYLAALQGAQRYEVNSQGELQVFYQTDQESGVLRFTAQTVRALW